MVKINVKLAETVAEKIEEFVAAKQVEGICEKSYKGYEVMLKIIFRDYLDTDIDDVNMDDVVKDIYSRDLAPASKNTLLRNLRAFLNFYGLPVNFKIHKVETVKETYTEEELKRLTKRPNKSAKFSEWRQYAIVLLALDTGLRSNSIRNIKVDDIQGNTVVVRTSKTGKISVLPFSTTTASALNIIRKSVQGKSEYLFCDVECNQMSENALKLSMKRYCDNRNVEHHSMHMLRHTFAKNWVVNGGNAIVLQRMLMHSSMEMTNHYVNLFSSDLQDNFISAVETVSSKRMNYSITK